MNLVMCRSCGEFTSALKEDNRLVSMEDDCPQCGGTEFTDNSSGEIDRTGREIDRTGNESG